ncbi:hypothetical protein [Streptomyces sp. V1I1]|uniref:hypothetical protein n=1 Tax=Streptomyces sp. V1I1 TaxID=3042272 RepID=UPI0027D8DB61|nr:hypothetical protein [Streptomyces sp. V1I1]
MELDFGDEWFDYMLAEWRAQRHMHAVEAMADWAKADRDRLREDLDKYFSTKAPGASLDEFRRYIEKAGQHGDGTAAPEGPGEAEPDDGGPPEQVATEGD